MDALEIAQDTNLLDSVLNGDSLHVLSQIPADVFHVCITDPPWSDYKDESLTADASTLPIFKEVYRTLKYNSLLYMVVSTPDFFMYSQELPKFGFKVQKHPLIWAKEGTITHGKRGWEYARDYEPILLAAKGDPLLTTATEQSAVITTRAVRSIDLTHPHEKPVELIARLLKDSTYEGSWALDPFGGSGVLAAACLQSGRHYMIIERNRKFYEQIVKRANAGRS
jgi:DNA modification methylase